MKMKNITISKRFKMLGSELNRAEMASLRPRCLASNLRGLSTRITLSDLMKPRSMVLKMTEIVAEHTIMKSSTFQAFLM